MQFSDNIQTARQLRNAVFAKFFEKTETVGILLTQLLAVM